MLGSGEFAIEFRAELRTQLIDCSSEHPEVLKDGDLEPALQPFAKHPPNTIQRFEGCLAILPPKKESHL